LEEGTRLDLDERYELLDWNGWDGPNLGESDDPNLGESRLLVDEVGTISDPVELRSTNADFYDLEDFSTIEALIETIEFCPPLLNHFQRLRWEKIFVAMSKL
jgi:hypothetical protein